MDPKIYCRIHPWVSEIYPCSLCRLEEEEYRDIEKEELGIVEDEYKEWCESQDD